MANWSGLWNGLASGTVASEDYALNSGRSSNRYHLTRLLHKRGMRAYREILTTALEDSTPTSTARYTYSRVQAAADTTANVQGGARTIEVKENIGGTNILQNTDVDLTGADAANGRAIAAADVTELQEDWATLGDRAIRQPTDGSGAVTYPADASGKKNIHGEAI